MFLHLILSPYGSYAAPPGPKFPNFINVDPYRSPPYSSYQPPTQQVAQNPYMPVPVNDKKTLIEGIEKKGIKLNTKIHSKKQL